MRTKQVTRIPERHVKPSLSDLKIGQSCWTTPWAILVSRSRRIYLDTTFPACDTSGGTVSLYVTRKANYWLCDITKGRDVDYTWEAGSLERHVPLDGSTPNPDNITDAVKLVIKDC